MWLIARSPKMALKPLVFLKKSIRSKDYYDLICLDVMMPHLDGVSTLKVIRTLEDSNNILPSRIVMMTCLDEADFKKELKGNFYYNKHLKKPLSYASIKEMLIEYGFYKEASVS